MGRICQDKNQIDVIEVASRVLARFPHTYFIIVGYAPEIDYLAKIKNEIEMRDLQKNIILHGYTSEVCQFLRGCDLMLHTAQKEPQGRVILEAMAAQLPVIAYRVGGIREAVIDQETGYLLPYGNIDGLVETVCKLLENSGLRHEMADKAHQHVDENFSAEITAKKVKTVINRLFLNG